MSVLLERFNVDMKKKILNESFRREKILNGNWPVEKKLLAGELIVRVRRNS